MGKHGNKAARHVSPGWFTHEQASSVGTAGFCFGFSDCPPLVVVLIERTDEAGADALTGLYAMLTAAGYPLCSNGKHSYLAAFTALDPGVYRGSGTNGRARGSRSRC